MGNKIDRARSIVLSILASEQHSLRRYDYAGDAPQCVELKLRNGAVLSFRFRQSTDLLSPLTRESNATDGATGWTDLGVKIQGKTMLHVRYCGMTFELVQFAPGSWERLFGVDPAGDMEPLLPPTLRNSAAGPLRSGMPHR